MFPIKCLLVVPCLVAITKMWIPCHFSTSDPHVTSGNIAEKSDSPPSSAPDLLESAFTLDHYTTLIQEPYRSDPCTPRRIHLAQKSNVYLIEIPKHESHYFHNRTTEYVVDMTVSFLLSYNDKCQNAIPKVFYRQGFHPEMIAVPDRPPLQFNFTSPIHNGTDFFQSDYIYHVTLPKIKAGGHRIFYRMEIHHDNHKEAGGRSHHHHHQEADVSETGTSPLLRGAGSSSWRALRLLGKTPTLSFLTPPLPNTPTAVALVGDLGQTKNSTKTMAHILHDSLTNNHPTTLLLVAGDMSYADADPWRWISWFDLMEPLTRSLPMHVAAGNHEIECDHVTLEIFQHYENYFCNPNRIANADLLPITNQYRQTLWQQSCAAPSQFRGHYNYGNAFYSFHHGSIHFIILSSYSDSQRGSPQYEWLSNELALNVNRTLTPWLIVSFHCPLYTTFLGHVDEPQSLEMKASMEPLFNEFHVNMVISGHDHGYMRSHSIDENGQVDSSGKSPIYLTLGAGGNREQHARGYRNETHPEEFVAKRDLKDFGYGNLLVVNATHALLNWVRDGIVGSDDSSNDQNVWILNPHYPVPNSVNHHNGAVHYETELSSDHARIS